jgi:hypothetical protein
VPPGQCALRFRLVRVTLPAARGRRRHGLTARVSVNPTSLRTSRSCRNVRITQSGIGSKLRNASNLNCSKANRRGYFCRECRRSTLRACRCNKPETFRNSNRKLSGIPRSAVDYLQYKCTNERMWSRSNHCKLYVNRLIPRYRFMQMSSFTYPTTRRDDTAEEHFGRKIADPYR